MSDPVNLNNTSATSAFVGAAIVSVWNLSTRISNAAKHSYENAQTALPLINAVSSRCFRILPRLITPYPFKSVVSIIDFMVNEALRQTQFKTPIRANEIETFIESQTYTFAFDSFTRKFLEQIESWKSLIIEDLNKAQSPTHNTMLESILKAFQRIDVESYLLFKPFFEKVFLLSRQTLVTQELIEEAQITLGKFILTPEKRQYQNYLETLVETSIKNLAQSDRAMRHLGKGRNRPGLDRLYNQTTDSVRLVTVYAVLLEVTREPQEISNCIREEKLTLARKLLINNETPLLNLVMEQLEIIESPQEQRQHRISPLTTHIEELAYDLAADDCVLSLPIIQLCSKTQTTAIVNLFNRVYKKSLKYIEPEYT